MKIEEEENSTLILIVVHNSVKSSFRSKEDKNKKKEVFSPQPSLPATVGVGCGEEPAEGRWSVSVTPWIHQYCNYNHISLWSALVTKKSQLKSRLEANLASRDPVRKPASLCKEVEAGKLASTGASSTLFGILKNTCWKNLKYPKIGKT